MLPILSRLQWAPAIDSDRQCQLRAAQTRLLYENANTGLAVTCVAAPVLAYFQSFVVSLPTTLGWLSYMLLLSAARFALVRRYQAASEQQSLRPEWATAFAIGAGLAGAGWGLAGIVLFPKSELTSQIFLTFVIGGMMLGGASLLASRAEAFQAFLIPSGLLPAIRLFTEGDKEHVLMGLLAAVFTCAAIASTWRFYHTIESSLSLQFQNDDLVEELQNANNRADAVNQQLEIRVRERTSELQAANERLRSEMEHREEMEQELLRVRNLESLGVLAGGIAHDFNNFLTVVQGNIELARMQLDPEEPIQDTLEDSATACRRAAFLSSQLLTFAKGGAPIRRVVSISDVILDAVNLAGAGASISIATDIAEDLWTANVDAGQIGQVLHNLLLNAKQAMPQGGSILVRAENVVLHEDHPLKAGEYLRISIRDHGCGISEDILPRIFDPYFTTKRSGSGLGLATTHAIVLKHDGHISAHSKSGEGSEFTILLPASDEHPAADFPIHAQVRTGTGKLLVMDDEEALRTLLNRTLTTLGYEVECARDGAEAIALYKSAQRSGHGFDAVLLDLTVSGGMGGVEAASQLRDFDPSVKLVVSSGYSDASIMSNFQDHGFDGVIPKPWQTAQVSEVFRKLLADSPQPLVPPTKSAEA